MERVGSEDKTLKKKNEIGKISAYSVNQLIKALIFCVVKSFLINKAIQ